jgi:hypothetical protein
MEAKSIALITAFLTMYLLKGCTTDASVHRPLWTCGHSYCCFHNSQQTGPIRLALLGKVLKGRAIPSFPGSSSDSFPVTAPDRANSRHGLSLPSDTFWYGNHHFHSIGEENGGSESFCKLSQTLSSPSSPRLAGLTTG